MRGKSGKRESDKAETHEVRFPSWEGVGVGSVRPALGSKNFIEWFYAGTVYPCEAIRRRRVVQFGDKQTHSLEPLEIPRAIPPPSGSLARF